MGETEVNFPTEYLKHLLFFPPAQAKEQCWVPHFAKGKAGGSAAAQACRTEACACVLDRSLRLRRITRQSR